MKIGYSCKVLGVPGTENHKCVLKFASDEHLMKLIDANLEALLNIIEYNHENGIELFRICSDLIPFGSHPVNDIKWWEVFKEKFDIIGDKIKKYGLRVSMHPGPYTRITSLKDDVTERAIEDLVYHNRVLDSLNTASSCKIIHHIGGGSLDKKSESRELFVENFKKIDDKIKSRIILENDAKVFNAEDVIEIALKCGVPVVIDVLHHSINHPVKGDIYYWLKEAAKTWRKEDGVPKIHYSDQNVLKIVGAHSDSINTDKFLDFYNSLAQDIDIMLEVKNKNISAIKCINLINNENISKRLKKEWKRYRFKVLECAPGYYDKIERSLDKYSAYDFYNDIEEALNKEIIFKNQLNAAEMVYDEIKDVLTSDEQEKFLKSKERFKNEKLSVNGVKNTLMRLSLSHNIEEITTSYYFVL